MKDGIKYEFEDTERTIIMKSLNMLRDYLTSQDRPTDSVDNLLIKVNSKSKLEVDIYDAKIIIFALNNLRLKYKNENSSREDRMELSKVMDKLIEKEGRETVEARFKEAEKMALYRELAKTDDTMKTLLTELDSLGVVEEETDTKEEKF